MKLIVWFRCIQNDINHKHAIFAIDEYKPSFPSSFLAFCSGAVGNITFQSINGLWKTLWNRLPTVSCSFSSVVYSGVITTSYMLFV